jgi:hypothetical protein
LKISPYWSYIKQEDKFIGMISRHDFLETIVGNMEEIYIFEKRDL